MTMLPPPPRLVDKPLRIDVVRPLEVISSTHKCHRPEEDDLLNLLNDMCSNPLLIDERLRDEDFHIFSLVRERARKLGNSPLTPDSALFYLELPHTVLMADAIQPLTIAAKKYLAAQYKDITRFREEVMALPLSGIEAILASDDLHVESEDALYDFVLEWAGRHYNNQEKRLEVLRMRLAPLIRFFYMTVSKLREVVANKDLKDYKLVFDALFLKCSRPCRAFGPYVPRTYDYLDFQVLRLETPSTECHVYLSLLRKRCATLFPTGRLQSPLFSWCGQEFFLSAECEFDSGRSLHFFSIYLRTQGNSSVNLVMEYKLAVRSKPTLEYEDQYIGNYTFNVGDIDDDKVLYVCTWDSFMAEDSRFSQDDISHFRANFTIQQ